jgi:hypothetical protein
VRRGGELGRQPTGLRLLLVLYRRESAIRLLGRMPLSSSCPGASLQTFDRPTSMAAAFSLRSRRLAGVGNPVAVRSRAKFSCAPA